jgi:protein-S-isoprenylcysteine O-methyltransferase Ste14
MSSDPPEVYIMETMKKSETPHRVLRYLKADLGIQTIIRYRVMILRIFSGALFLLLLVSKSRWNGHIMGHLLMLSGILLAAIGAIGRIWCALFIAGYKNQSLVTVGPYSVTRNPLYFFSLLGATGVGLASESFLFPGIIFLGFMLYFPFVIRQEEKDLKIRHRESFQRYLKKTPILIPDLTLFREPEKYPVHTRIFKRTLMDALWFIWAAGLIHFLRYIQNSDVWPILMEIY